MSTLRRDLPWLAALLALAVGPPAPALAQTGGASADGADSTRSQPVPSPGASARIVNGKAVPPRGAPRAVVAAIEAGNRIATRPYRWGGGHARWEDSGYDCSGAVSYVLHGARMLATPLDAVGLGRWGRPGRGRWITVYWNRSHAFIVVAGLRFDTGWRDPRARRYGTAPGSGPRWGGTRSTRAFAARHPAGL